MKFLKMLEENDKMGAIKEIKSKLDGLKSGKLIDLEEQLVESYSTVKEKEHDKEDDKEKDSIKESMLITEVSSKDIEELNKDMKKLNKLKREHIDALLDDNSTKSTFKMRQEIEKIEKEITKKHGSNSIKAYLENNGISFEDMIDSGTGSGELSDMAKSLEK